MNNEGLKTITISAQCKNVEEEMIFNQKIFAFNELVTPHAIAGVGEKNPNLPYVVEVLIQENSATAFINYLTEKVPEAKIK